MAHQNEPPPLTDTHDFGGSFHGKRRRRASSEDAPLASASSSAKRFRRANPTSALPAPLLQRVLQYELSLSDLAAVARVSPDFNYLLSQARPQHASAAQTTTLPPPRKRATRKIGSLTTETARTYMQEALLSQAQSQDFLHHDEIWRAARSRIRDPPFPNLPPLTSERQLWSLLSQRTCQYCQQKPVQSRATSGGDDFAHIIWPFEVVSCSSCLLDRVEMSSKTLQNPQNAIFVFILPHIRISSAAPHEVTAIPIKGPSALKKYTLKQQLDRSRANGAPGKVERDNRQRQTEEFMALAAQWEDWDRNHPNRSHPRSPAPLEIRNPRPRLYVGSGRINLNESRPEFGGTEVAESSDANAIESPSLPFDQQASKTASDRDTCLARRKAEILRRCATLKLPIPLTILQQTPAFVAAIQIPRDLDDADWGFLQPRLEEQCRQAEATVHKTLSSQDVAWHDGEQQRPRKAASETSEGLDNAILSNEQIRQQFEALQKPTHDRLVKLFNEYVSVQANRGKNINNQPMDSFILRGLDHVHRRFAFRNDHNAGQKLKMQEIKWLLTNKIQELYPDADFKIFRCPICPPSNNHPGGIYTLDDLVQHHASTGHPLSKYANSSNRIVLNSAPWDKSLFWVPADRPDSRPTPAAANFSEPATPVPGWTHPSYGQPPLPGPSPQFSNSWSMPPPSPQYPGAGTPGAPSPFTAQFHSPHPGYPPPTGPPWASAPHTPIQVQSSPVTMTTPTSRPPFQQYQQDVLADIAASTWQQLNPVKTLPLSVRCQVVIQHSVSLFKHRFRNEPNVDVFVQAVTTNVRLDQLKHAHGVACKACTEQERKAPLLQTFSQLIMHFKDEHVQRASAIQQASTHGKPDELQRLDWTRDMIWLAARPEVVNTQKDYYMTAEIWELIRGACPDYELDQFSPLHPPSAYAAAVPASSTSHPHLPPHMLHGPHPGPPPQGPPYHQVQPHAVNHAQPVWVPPGAASPPPGVQWCGPASPPPSVIPSIGYGAGGYGGGAIIGQRYPHQPPAHSMTSGQMPTQYAPGPQQHTSEYASQASQYDVNQPAFRPPSEVNFRHDAGHGHHADWRAHSNIPSPVSNFSGTATASTVPSPAPGASSRPDIKEILAKLNMQSQPGSTPSTATSSAYPPSNPGNPCPPREYPPGPNHPYP